MGIEGQFCLRHRGSLLSHIMPGSSPIYPAVLAGWIFLACVLISPRVARFFAIAIFIISLIVINLVMAIYRRSAEQTKIEKLLAI
jgi:hypothetical protein